VIAGERPHEALRQLPAQRRLEANLGVGPVVQASKAGAMVEQAGDGSAVVLRSGVHGTPTIVARRFAGDP
jgi:hypothetical protein